MTTHRAGGLSAARCTRCGSLWLAASDAAAMDSADGDGEPDARALLETIGQRLDAASNALQAFFDNAPVEMVVKDETGRYLHINPRTESLYSRSSDEVRGKRPQDLFPTDSARTLHETDLSVIASGAPRVIEVEDGFGGVFQATSFPIVDESRRVVGVGGVGVDISELRRAESALSRLNRELEQRIEARTEELRAAQGELLRQERLASIGAIAATVSHELRNPLGVIGTSLYVLQQVVVDDDERIRHTFERARRNIERCDRILDELAGFALQRDPERAAIALDRALAVAVEEWTARTGQRVHTTLDVPDVEIVVDTEQLGLVLAKLLDNAADAVAVADAPPTELAEPAISIITRASSDTARIEIADHAGGMPPEILDKIFDPLFSTKGFGVGLGLTVVRDLVERNGGQIDVQSTAGTGTRVSLEFPIGDTPDPEP